MTRDGGAPTVPGPDGVREAVRKWWRSATRARRPKGDAHAVLRELLGTVEVSAWKPELDIPREAVNGVRDRRTYGRAGEGLGTDDAVRRLTAGLPGGDVGLAADDPATLAAAVTCRVRRLVDAARDRNLRLREDDYATAIVTPSVVLIAYRASDGVIPLKATTPSDAGRSIKGLIDRSPDPYVRLPGWVGPEGDRGIEAIRDAVLAATIVEPLPDGVVDAFVRLGIDVPGSRQDPAAFFSANGKARSSPLGRLVLRAMRPIGYERDARTPFANRSSATRLVPTTFAVRNAPPGSAVLRASRRLEAFALLDRIADQTGSKELSKALETIRGTSPSRSDA